MRTKNSFFNFLANTGSQIVNIILSFVTRTVFIYMLGQEYLGINGLFGNILTVLNLAELGIGTAMIYHIYKPVADEDEREQQKLMNMYRRLYTIVALVIAACGLCLTPFLDYLIKDKPDIPGLTAIYLLYLFNTVSSYFFSYKRAIIEAHQKAYINTIITTFLMTAQFLLQIVILLITRNFIAYLLVQIACNVLTNVVISIQADRMYPYLKADRKSLPEEGVRKSIYKNIGAMFLHRLGDVVVNNTDNLLMSAFVGIYQVGIYSNYIMIQSSVNTILNGVVGAVTASVGNLNTENDKESLFRVYKIMLFLGFWIFGYAAVTFMVMYNPFILTWAGSSYLFETKIVLAIVAIFYVNGMRKITITFRDAMGLYWYDRYKPIFEVIVNLVSSIWLVNVCGTIGIFYGTLISTVGICLWVEPYVTYKHGFFKPVSHYFMTFALYTAIMLAAGGATYYVCRFIPDQGWGPVFLKLLVCTVMYNVIILILFCRTYEFRELWKIIKDLYERLVLKRDK